MHKKNKKKKKNEKRMHCQQISAQCDSHCIKNTDRETLFSFHRISFIWRFSLFRRLQLIAYIFPFNLFATFLPFAWRFQKASTRCLNYIYCKLFSLIRARANSLISFGLALLFLFFLRWILMLAENVCF